MTFPIRDDFLGLSILIEIRSRRLPAQVTPSGAAKDVRGISVVLSRATFVRRLLRDGRPGLSLAGVSCAAVGVPDSLARRATEYHVRRREPYVSDNSSRPDRTQPGG